MGSLGAKEVNSLDSIGRTSYSAGKIISSLRQEVREQGIRSKEQRPISIDCHTLRSFGRDDEARRREGLRRSGCALSGS